MAQIASTGAEQAADTAKNTTDTVVEVGKRTADQTATATREAAERTANVARRGVHAVRQTVEAAAEVESAVAHRAAEGTAELGQALLDLVHQQTRHNLATLTRDPDRARPRGRLGAGHQGRGLGPGGRDPERVRARQPGAGDAAHAAVPRDRPSGDGLGGGRCQASGPEGGLKRSPLSRAAAFLR